MKKTFHKPSFTKIVIMILGIIGLGFFIHVNGAQAQNFYYDYDPGERSQDQLNIAEIMKKDAIQGQNTVIYKLREAFKLTGGIYEKSEKKAIDYIKMIVNIALGLVAFISLGLVLFAFYIMFFTEQEDGLTKAKKILRGVFIALIVMGVSYFIVSFIFYLYHITTGAGTA